MGDNTYNQGEQLQLNCSSEGGPGLGFTWYFSGSSIATNNTLTIDNVNTTHGGEYTCNVTNMAGFDIDTFTVYSEFCVYKLVIQMLKNNCTVFVIGLLHLVGNMNGTLDQEKFIIGNFHAKIVHGKIFLSS